MQSKISSFLKASSSSYSSSFDDVTKSPDRTSVAEDGDELDFWEKKQHHFSNTYTRRPRFPHCVQKDNEENCELLNEEPIDNSTKPIVPSISGRTLVKNKKRSYAQFHLEFGQSDFVLHTCSTCGIKYVAGDKKDERIHKNFHKDYTHGIQLKGWSNERVVRSPSSEDGRIVMVLESDSAAHKNKVRDVVKMMETELGSGWIYNMPCKVYLFILRQRVVGCAVAEPIKKAFKVVSLSANRKIDAKDSKDDRARSTTLRFGSIRFRREIAKRTSNNILTQRLDEDLKANIFCEKEAVPAVCGIRAIWVSTANRRKHIATKLLDAVRESFLSEFVIERPQLAFSQPTLPGKALASKYIGGGSLLVYKSNNLKSDDLS